jgi:hypothetical protein
VGFTSGQELPLDEVREALTHGDIPESTALAIQRFTLHVQGEEEQNPRPR